MERNHRTPGGYSASIITPRFPHLKEKSSFEVAQYSIGREETIKKFETLYRKFESYFDLINEPIITENTEPFEVVQWYAEVAIEICKANGVEENIAHFFESKEKETDSGINMSANHLTLKISEQPNGFYMMSFGWIRFIKPNYRAWLLFIMRRLHEFGIDNQYRYLKEVKECDPYLDLKQLEAEKEMHDPEEFHDLLVQQDLFECQFQDMMRKKLPFEKAKRPLRLEKPKKGEHEEWSYELIKQGIKIIDRIEPDQKIWQLSNYQEAAEQGHLGIDQLYFLCESNQVLDDFTDTYLFQNIEDVANNAGISNYCIELDDKEEFDMKKFDFSLIFDLNIFHQMISDTANLIETSKGLI